MSEEKFEETVRPRIKLPKPLWHKVREIAPFEGITPSKLVANTLSKKIQEVVDYSKDGKETEVEIIDLDGSPDLEGSVRPGIELPKDLWEKAKATASRHDVAAYRFVETTLKEFVEDTVTLEISGKDEIKIPKGGEEE